MSYQSALFCQIFEEELEGVGPHKTRVLRALRRLSPTSSGRKLRTYAAALTDTIVVGDELRPDWKTRVFTEH